MSDEANPNVSPVAPEVATYSTLVGRSFMSDEALEDKQASLSGYNRRSSKDSQLR